MASDDSSVPPGSSEAGSKFYKPTDQAFTKATRSTEEDGTGDGMGGAAGGIAPLLPLQGRLLASLIASSLTGLSLGARILLTIATVIFIVREMVETRRDWYSGSAAIEQVELTRIQQQRERAEVIVAETASRKNIQEELKAVAEREAEVMSAVKHVQEGWGSALAQSGGANMIRFRDGYQATKTKLKACQDSGSCSDTERLRLEGQADMYRMLFSAAKGSLLTAMDKTKSTVSYPLNMELEPKPEQ